MEYFEKEYYTILNKKDNKVEFEEFINDKPINFLLKKINNKNPLEILIDKNQLEKFTILIEKIPMEFFELDNIINVEIISVEQLLANILMGDVLSNTHFIDSILLKCFLQLEKKNSGFLEVLITKIENEAINNYEKIYKRLLNILFFNCENPFIYRKILENPKYNLINYIKSNPIIINFIVIKSTVITNVDFFKYFKSFLNKLEISNEDILINRFFIHNYKSIKFKRGSMTLANIIENLKPLNPNYKTKLFLPNKELYLSSILLFLGNWKVLNEISFGKTLENFDNDLITLISNNSNIDLTNEIQSEHYSCIFKPFIELYKTGKFEGETEKILKYLKIVKKYFGSEIKIFLKEQINKITNQTENIIKILEILT
jgi:hypothetical protein